jgi:uncharacterized delta-60 repeat protein
MKMDRLRAVCGLVCMGAALLAAPAKGQAAGSLDTTFGSKGLATTTLASNFNGVPEAVFELANDDLLVVVSGGLTGSGETAVGLVRYKPNGQLDTTFGSNGVVVVPIASDPNVVAATLDASGNIVLATTAFQTVNGRSESGLGAIRITASGELDSSFGSGGVVSTFFGNLNESASTVLVQPNGLIVVAGFEPSLSRRSPVQTALVRYSARGVLDPSFGSGGIAQAATEITGPTTLALLTNGDYLGIEGSSEAEFSSAGVLQSTIVGSTPVASGAAATTLLEANGDYLTISTTAVNPNGIEVPRNSSFIHVARFSETGVADSSFTATTFGFVPVTSSNTDLVNRNAGGGIGLESNGQIIVAGGVSGSGSEGPNGPIPAPGFLGLARLNANGGLDSTFGNGGLVTNSATAFAAAMVLQSDGNIVVVGQAANSSGGEFGPTIVVARYLAN